MAISLTAPTGSLVTFRIAKITAVVLLTALITAASLLMIGPQIMFIAPLALVAGIVFAVCRSFWSLVCFGYPLTFALVSAWVGYWEMPGYERTGAFSFSIMLGLVGVGLIATGLWQVLLGSADKPAGRPAGG